MRARRRSRLRPVVLASATPFRAALPWLLASLVLTLLPLIGQVPFWTLALFGGCTAWRYRLEQRDKPLPTLPARLLVFVPVAYLIWRTYGAKPNATGMLAFLIALLSLKVLELRSMRDFTIAALLGYFMILSALFYDQSFGLCLYLAAIVLLNSAALIRCHGGPQKAWQTLRLACGMGLQALPLVVLLFVVFPRVQGTFLHSLGRGDTGQTGMSDHLQPGSFSALAQSDALAFRAIVNDKKPINQGQLYWRGLVLEICDRSMSWRASNSPGYGSAEPTPGADTITQTITLLGTGEHWLFALDRPTGIKPPSSLHADLLGTQTLRSRAPVEGKVTYTAYSTRNAQTTKQLTDYQRRLYTQLPHDENPRALSLARSWRRNAGTNDGEVLRAASRFFQANHFVYTLNPGLLPDTGPLDYFLFTSRHGFCEHYAAAYSTLMRAAGIPARIVLGYQGGELNRFSPHYTVRQSDAHAWSEVWLQGQGWVREDPTGFVAPDRVSYGAENYASLDGALTDELRLERLNGSGPWRWLVHNGSQLWDDADEQWNLLVLGYDQDAQITALENLGLANLSGLGQTALIVAAVFAILGIGAAVIQLFDRQAPGKHDTVRRLYERFCRKLAGRAGLERAAAEGPLDFARRASNFLPSAEGDIRRITDLYVASRYAKDGGASLVAALRQAVGRFRVPRPPASKAR